MTRHQQLSQWLADRQRKYADGVEIFKELASDSIKKKYLNYFEVNYTPVQFDPHFTMLVNKLTDLERTIRTSPEAYKKAMEEIITVPTGVISDQEKQELLADKQTLIDQLTKAKQELTDQIVSRGEADTDKDSEIDQLQEQLEDKEEQLTQLREEVEQLSKPGIKIVREADLSPSLKIAYSRIREVTPIIAVLHAEISNTDLSDEERKKKAEELCNLDDERRKHWRDIDKWAEGKELQLEEKRPEYSENPLICGMQMERQSNRLKQNIHNSRLAAERAEKEGKQTVKQNALDRIAKYEKELVELEIKVKSGQETVQ